MGQTLCGQVAGNYKNKFETLDLNLMIYFAINYNIANNVKIKDFSTRLMVCYRFFFKSIMDVTATLNSITPEVFAS
jgi:hypothetical protein